MTCLRTAWCLILLTSAACGGAPPPKEAAPAAPAAAPAPSASAPKGDDYDDPNESDKPIQMEVTFPPKPKYAKATVKEADCWKAVELTGKNEPDFAALVEKCGGPSGAVEYVKPAHGKLHHVHSAIAIIDGSKAWCQETDSELDFRIKISGEGKGGYTFGVWARPM
jgi:hypothetical protein